MLISALIPRVIHATPDPAILHTSREQLQCLERKETLQISPGQLRRSACTEFSAVATIHRCVVVYGPSCAAKAATQKSASHSLLSERSWPRGEFSFRPPHRHRCKS